MRISIDKNLIEFTPEDADETAELEAVWRLLVDCVRFNKRLVPVGEYVPQKNRLARFTIEGPGVAGAGSYPEVPVGEDCMVYCQTCNKLAKLNAGDLIPPCCGRLMVVMD